VILLFVALKQQHARPRAGHVHFGPSVTASWHSNPAHEMFEEAAALLA